MSTTSRREILNTSYNNSQQLEKVVGEKLHTADRKIKDTLQSWQGTQKHEKSVSY